MKTIPTQLYGDVIHYLDTYCSPDTKAVSISTQLKCCHDELLTISEVCKYLKVTTRTVHRMIEDGRLQALKNGGLLRFSNIEVRSSFKPKSLKTGNTSRRGAEAQSAEVENNAPCPHFEPEDPKFIPWEAFHGE